jgi:sugar diacid utilization regulator
MDQFKNFLQELSSNTKINFSITYEDGNEIFKSKGFVESSDILYIPISICKNRAGINLESKFKACSKLLKYTIENKYKELYLTKEQILMEILEGKNVSNDEVSSSIPFLSKGCFLFLVYVEKNIQEALAVIKQIYRDQEVISIIDDNKIIVLGVFSETSEHAKSIKEAINSNLFLNCKISFSNIFHDKYEMVSAFNESKEAMIFGDVYSLREDILDYNKLIFEKIVYNLDSELKQKLLNNFAGKFNEFDYEMINTIEEFFNCGLNITDASRKLYVHRNTLIYRLCKIEKETGFDIKNFKNATVFIIAFLVWRESK